MNLLNGPKVINTALAFFKDHPELTDFLANHSQTLKEGDLIQISLAENIQSFKLSRKDIEAIQALTSLLK